MNKVIAIVDMPNHCGDCQFLSYFGLTHPYCSLIGLHNIDSLEVDFHNRPLKCPLIKCKNFSEDKYENIKDDNIKGMQNVLNRMFYERDDLNE